MDIQAAYRGHSSLGLAALATYPFTMYCATCSANVARLPGNRCTECVELTSQFKRKLFLPPKLDGCPAKEQARYINPRKIQKRL